MTSTSGRGSRDDPSLSEVLYILQRRRLLVVGVVLVLAGVALLLGLFREPVYTAEARVSVTPQETLDNEEARLAFLEEVRGSVVTQEMLDEVRRRAGWEAGKEEFAERLDPRTAVTRDGRTGLQIRFSGPEPEQAARAANAYAELFVERVDDLGGRPLADGIPGAEASMEQRAVPGGYSPRPFIYAAIAAGAGLLLGGAVALLLEGRASGWRGVRDAELTLRAPVLGTIPDYSSKGIEG
ncbi:MAG TPA: Wzz/FepE/Etk N-terminal domain-containing protein [Rubrobacter sp.]|nr:Wzz/FepE/Etk N-terminal domain-containing protein [Rubrobacter sp.]